MDRKSDGTAIGILSVFGTRHEAITMNVADTVKLYPRVTTVGRKATRKQGDATAH